MTNGTLASKKYFVKDKVERLLKLVPVERPSILSYDQWEQIVGCDWRTPEGMAVAKAWRREVLEKHDTFILAEGAFRFPTAAEQTSDLMRRRMRGMRRRIRKDMRILTHVAVNELTSIQDQARLHQLAGAAALARQVREQRRELLGIEERKMELLPR